MKQEISNNEKDWIEYFHEIQKITKILKKAYSNKYKRFEKEIFNLNTSAKRINTIEKFKLHW